MSEEDNNSMFYDEGNQEESDHDKFSDDLDDRNSEDAGAALCRDDQYNSLDDSGGGQYKQES